MPLLVPPVGLALPARRQIGHDICERDGMANWKFRSYLCQPAGDTLGLLGGTLVGNGLTIGV